nr:hypothetical protein [Armatimonadota bacterium]
MTRPAWTKSLRFQLTFWYVATLAVILATAAVLLLQGARVTLLRETDQALALEADRIAQAAAPAPVDETDESDERPDPTAIVAQSNSAFGGVPGVGSNPLLVR